MLRPPNWCTIYTPPASRLGTLKAANSAFTAFRRSRPAACSGARGHGKRRAAAARARQCPDDRMSLHDDDQWQVLCSLSPPPLFRTANSVRGASGLAAQRRTDAELDVLRPSAAVRGRRARPRRRRRAPIFFSVRCTHGPLSAALSLSLSQQASTAVMRRLS